MYDMVIVGGGPAGLSAAVNCAARGKSCAVVTNNFHRNPLSKSKQIDNYLGMRGMSGEQMLEKMVAEATEAGAEFVDGRVTSILPMDKSFAVGVGDNYLEARRLILCTGVLSGGTMPGEVELLGRGVSYCATCDGMLYRHKKAVVTGNAGNLVEEAEFLKSIGVEVTIVTAKKPDGVQDIPCVQAKKIAILGSDCVEAVMADDEKVECQAVFILREVISAGALLPGLEMDEKFIRVNRNMETNIPGVYAAGDCTGRPLQVSKAVGEGLVAAQNAAFSIDKEEKDAAKA